MNKQEFTKESYQEIIEITIANAKEYLLCINPVEKDDKIIAITERYYSMPTQEDKDKLYAAWLQAQKNAKIGEIKAYDISENVNGFLLNGQHAWLSKNDRASLRSLVQIQKESGMTATTLWYGEQSFQLPVDNALAMLSALELYASQCYNKTAEHIATVSALTIIEDVEAYDHTVGYPEQPSFEV